jgi:hypothetical protein
MLGFQPVDCTGMVIVQSNMLASKTRRVCMFIENNWLIGRVTPAGVKCKPWFSFFYKHATSPRSNKGNRKHFFPQRLKLCEALHSFTCFPKTLPLGQGMVGLKPVECADMVIVKDKIVGNELVRTVLLPKLSLRIKLLWIKWLAGLWCLVSCPENEMIREAIPCLKHCPEHVFCTMLGLEKFNPLRGRHLTRSIYPRFCKLHRGLFKLIHFLALLQIK